MLIISLCISAFLFYEGYRRQSNKLKSYYWVYKGDKAFKKKDLQGAINYYERGVKLNPKHYRALYNLANLYVYYEDYYSAIENYEKALQIKPDYETARINYAIILSQVYKTDEAIENYEKVLKYKPKFIKIPFLVDNKKTYTYNKGVALYNMGFAYKTKSLLAGLNKKASREYLLKASESYKEATEILDNYNSNYNLALIHQLLKNYHQSAHYYCRAIEIAPMEYEAHFNYAVLLNDLKDYASARTEFKKAGLLLDSNGNSSKTRYIYGILADVNNKAALEGLKDDDELIGNYQYKAGKLVTGVLEDDKKSKKKNKDKDLELRKNFSICANSELYYKNNNKKKDKGEQ